MGETPTRSDQPTALKSSRRRWYQFGLRTLLIGVALLALPSSYIGWQAKIMHQRKSLLAQIVNRGGGYWIALSPLVSGPGGSSSLEVESFGSVPSVQDFRPTVLPAENNEPPKIRQWIGDEPIFEIYLGPKYSSAEIAEIAKHFPEAIIDRPREESLTLFDRFINLLSSGQSNTAPQSGGGGPNTVPGNNVSSPNGKTPPAVQPADGPRR